MTNYKSEIITNTDYDIMFYPLPVYIKLSDNLLVQLDLNHLTYDAFNWAYMCFTNALA